MNNAAYRQTPQMKMILSSQQSGVKRLMLSTKSLETFLNSVSQMSCRQSFVVCIILII